MFLTLLRKQNSKFAYLKIHNKRLCKTALVYHSHLGKVNQVVFCVVWRALLNKRQVCKIHPQVWHTWRITTSRNISTLLDKVYYFAEVYIQVHSHITSQSHKQHNKAKVINHIMITFLKLLLGSWIFLQKRPTSAAYRLLFWSKG